MGKINREELFKILDEQHERCKTNLAEIMDDNIQKLHNYGGDVIDIKTEILVGQALEQSLFRLVDEDYYDKQKLLSESVAEGPSLSELFSLNEYKPRYRTQTVTAPTKHKKKYFIKFNNRLDQDQLDNIAQTIAEQQFIIYNQDTIEQIITLDVE
jgi:hypothetical protein